MQNVNVSWFRSHMLLSSHPQRAEQAHTGLWVSEFTTTHSKQTFTEGKKRCFFCCNKHRGLFSQAERKLVHTFVLSPLFCLIFTELVEVFAFKTASESEVLRALMTQSWRSHFHMSCHLSEVWAQGKVISQPLSIQTFACALQLLSVAPEVSSVATPCINNKKSESSVFLFRLAIVKI